MELIDRVLNGETVNPIKEIGRLTKKAEGGSIKSLGPLKELLLRERLYDSDKFRALHVISEVNSGKKYTVNNIAFFDFLYQQNNVECKYLAGDTGRVEILDEKTSMAEDSGLALNDESGDEKKRVNVKLEVPEERVKDFREVEQGFSCEEEAREEAMRCLRCDLEKERR